MERAVRTQEEAQAALAAVQPGEVDGVLAPRCCALNIPGFILDTTTQRGHADHVRGALLGGAWRPRQLRPGFIYLGPDGRTLGDKIRKGVPPGRRFPMEVNPKIEFVINLKVATSTGADARSGGVVSGRSHIR